jgi:hypothetical protein
MKIGDIIMISAIPLAGLLSVVCPIAAPIAIAVMAAGAAKADQEDKEERKLRE